MAPEQTGHRLGDSERGALATVAGALLGLVLSPLGKSLWAGVGAGPRTFVFVALGAAVGGLGYLVSRRLRIDSMKIAVPGLGEAVLKLESRQRQAGWRIFVELATRIATQPLSEDAGFLREALTSHYRLFELIRGELKSMPPSTARLSEEEANIETYALAILNRALRPRLARWHPRLADWEATGMPEHRWPLAAACRRDLEAARIEVLAYTHELGRLLRVPKLDRLLPPRADEPLATAATPPLEPPAGAFVRDLGSKQVQVAWTIYVELSTRIATQPLAEGTGLVAEALDSLYALFGAVRQALASLPGPTPASDGDADTVEAIGFRVLNQHLRPFLATWHPRLKSWRAEHPQAPEPTWPDDAACRAALAEARERIAAEAQRLRGLLAIAPSDPDR